MENKFGNSDLLNMSDNDNIYAGYTIKVKFAPFWTNLDDGTHSKTGHEWYEGYYNGELIGSRGWSAGDNKMGQSSKGIDNLSFDDNAHYVGTNKHIIEIEMQVSYNEMDILLYKYPQEVISGNHQSMKDYYELFSNNCIDFSSIGLQSANLVKYGFEGEAAALPSSDRNVLSTLNALLEHNERCVYFDNGKEKKLYLPESNNYDKGYITLSYETTSQEAFSTYYCGDNKQYQEQSNDIDKDIVTAEKPEQVGNNNTPNFAENYNIGNSNNFFGEYLNQYAEDNGISHINTYDYRQFANDDNSSNGISYLNDYNLSFGSRYWRQPFDYYNGFGEHQETITESELERILDDNNESKIKDTLMDLQTGSLKIDTDGFSSISSSLEKKLEENNISKTEIENAIKTSHSSSWNLFDDLPMYDMPVIYDMPMHAYELPYYIEDTQEFNSQQAINDNEDNSVSGSLNDNHQDNMIARVSDDPIILVKDENGIDKVMSVSEYEQYNALLQERLNNELNQAKQEIHEELNNVEDTLNQQIDNIEQDILSTELSSNENDSIIDTYSIQNDNTENEIISFEEYLKQQENSFNFDDDDLFKVISDEEVFSINNEHCCDCKDDNPDDWLF